MLSRGALLALVLAPLSVVGRQFVITNLCPQHISLYINGENQGTLLAGRGTITRDFPHNWSGFIYTDANGGNQNGVNTTRAGFYGQDDYYYIVIDPNHLNTGVSISTNQTERQGYCRTAVCNILTCPDAFHQPPTRFPPPGSTSPAPPLFSCPTDSLEYYIKFCPDGNLPGGDDQGVELHPNDNTSKCLDVQGAVYANGTPVQIYDCNGTGAQKWVVNKGQTKVRVAGTNFCLDAGSAPANGVKGKIWQCYDNLPAQDWWYTDDNRIALTDRGLCLDLTNGITTNANPVQTWQCTDGNTNQIWRIF